MHVEAIVQVVEGSLTWLHPKVPAGFGTSDRQASHCRCEDEQMRVVVLTGGVGGARFLRGLKALQARPGQSTPRISHITAIANTGDDITLHGLRICPDLDTVMYTLGQGIDQDRGWGREGETFTTQAELSAYGAGPDWFGLGDKDLATHLIRTRMLDAGYSLTDVTAALCKRWDIGITLLPMSDERVETHVFVEQDGEKVALHFQQWWLEHRAGIPALGFANVGADQAQPAPGAIEAIQECDLVLLAPSNPVVSISPILAVPGIKEALQAKTVIGVSPIIGGSPVRGFADACLAAIGVQTQAGAVAKHLGAKADGGVLSGWLVDDVDADQVQDLESFGIRAKAVPLWMSDVDATAEIAREALALAEGIR